MVLKSVVAVAAGEVTADIAWVLTHIWVVDTINSINALVLNVRPYINIVLLKYRPLVWPIEINSNIKACNSTF